MAAGFILKKINLENFKKFILRDFSKNVTNKNFSLLYDAEISSHAFNLDFYSQIKKLEPFGMGNPNPIFLFKDLLVIRKTIINHKHLSIILKSRTGFSIKSIFFNYGNSKVAEYLLNYKKKINVLGQINENIWNNKKGLQLNIRDLII